MKRLTAILTAALLLVTASLPVFAEPETSAAETSAAETSAAETSAAETSAAETSAAETSAAETSAAETSAAETSAAETSAAETSAAETSAAETSAAENSAETEEVTMKPYRIEEAEMDLSVPSVMSVITRDTKEDDPVFKENRTTKAESDKSFKENDMYLRANTKDFSCSVSVVVNETDDTQKIGNLSSLSEENIQTIINKIQESPIYTGCARVRYNGVLFLSFTITYESEGTKVHGLQEYTIINGRCVKITYQTADLEENDPNKALFGEIMETVTFDGVAVVPPAETESSPSVSLVDIDIRFIYIMIAATIGVISLMIIILVGIKYSQTKRKNKEDDLLYDDEGESDDTLLQKDKNDDETEEASEEYSKDIYSDTGRKKAPAAEAKPMTYDDVISAKGNFTAEDIKTPEMPEKKIEASEKAKENAEPKFIIVMDDEDVPQAPLKWDDISEEALENTLKPSLDELKKEGIQEEAYQKAWNAAKAEKSARIAKAAQEARASVKTPAEKSENTAKPEKTSKAAKADKAAKIADRSGKDVPVTESTIELPELGNAPEYVPIVGLAAADIAASVGSSKDALPEKDDAAPEPVKSSGDDNSIADEKTKLPNGDVPQDMKNFFKFNNQKDNRESENNHSDQYEAAMKNVTPVSSADDKKDSQDSAETFEFYTGYAEDGSLNASEYEKRFDNKAVADNFGVSGEPEVSDKEPVSRYEKIFGKPEPVSNNTDKLTDVSNTDAPSSTAAEAVENAVLSGMIDRLRTANSEADKNTEQNENNFTGEILRGDAAQSEQKPEEKKPQGSGRAGAIELEISKAADGSLVIGAKNDANGQPMDIEIRDASHFKEDRDKEMAAMGLETASDNEIYNAWKIENEENPFVVKTISEVRAEEGDDSKGNDADEKEADSEKTEDTVLVTEKSEQSDEPVDEEESGSTSQKAADAGVEAVVAVFDLANLSKGKKSGEKTLETQDKAEEPKIETVEEFLEGVKSAAPLEAGGIDPKEQQPERDENMFEKESGIAFERPSEYQPPIVPMNTPFTRIPRLESVNAEEYHKEYDELKKTLPKNQFYAQRFSSANITQPFVETAKPITASPEPAVEQTDNGDSSDGSEKRFGRNRRNKNKLKEKSAESQGDSTFEYYTGYEEADDPFSVQNPDEELLIKDHKKKSGDSFGSKFKKSFSSLFSNDIPDE